VRFIHEERALKHSPLQVSWIRKSDLKILSIGRSTYTGDSRFSPMFHAEDNVQVANWMLKVVRARPEDSGDYECQVAFHDDVERRISQILKLKVLGESPSPKKRMIFRPFPPSFDRRRSFFPLSIAGENPFFSPSPRKRERKQT